MYLPYIFTPEFHMLMTSLTHPRKILLVVLKIEKKEIGKAEDLSATLRIFMWECEVWYIMWRRLVS
jgi:hypothetical protein